MSTIQAFFFIGNYVFISYLAIIVDYKQLFKCSILCLTTPLRHLVTVRNDERMNSSTLFLNIFTQELFNRIYVGKYHPKHEKRKQKPSQNEQLAIKKLNEHEKRD